jgi:hypothetical protein
MAQICSCNPESRHNFIETTSDIPHRVYCTYCGETRILSFPVDVHERSKAPKAEKTC